MASGPSHVRLMLTLAAFAAMLCGHQPAQGATLTAGASLDEGFLFFKHKLDGDPGEHEAQHPLQNLDTRL
jgi:hypothetical protein